MRFILATADFSGDGKNIGTLDDWFITYNTPSGVSWTDISSSVAKGEAFSAVFEIADPTSYELSAITVSMGTVSNSSVGSTSNGITISSSGTSPIQYTISITEATADIKISLTTTNLSTGGTDSGGSSSSSYPTTTTWYVTAASTDLSTECAASNTSNGWTYGNSDEQEAIRNKPINAVRFATSSASGTVTIGVATSQGATTISQIQQTTFTNSSGSKAIVTAKFSSPITLGSGEYLIFEPYTDDYTARTWNFYFGSNGPGEIGFISRIPNDLGASGANPWRSISTNSIGWDVGYVV